MSTMKATENQTHKIPKFLRKESEREMNLTSEVTPGTPG